MKYSLLVILLLTLPLFAGEYIRHSDMANRVSYIIPEKKWSFVFHNLGNRTYHIMTHKDGTTVSITTVDLNSENLEKWNTWQEWYVRGRGTDLYTILNRGKIEGTMPSSKLILIQYKMKKKTYMERILIKTNREKMVIVSCRSREKFFNSHSNTFNSIMGSVTFLHK